MDRVSDRTLVRHRATRVLARVRSTLEWSEATDAETDCAAYCVATEGLERQGKRGADCQGQNAAAISRAEGCS